MGIHAAQLGMSRRGRIDPEAARLLRTGAAQVALASRLLRPGGPYRPSVGPNPPRLPWNEYERRRAQMAGLRGPSLGLARTAISPAGLRQLAPNLRESWISSYYARGGRAFFDPSLPSWGPGLTAGNVKDVTIGARPGSGGLPGIFGHEAVHGTAHQALGGWLRAATLAAGYGAGLSLQALGARPTGTMSLPTQMASAYNEFLPYQVGGPGRTGWLKDVPPWFRPLVSGIVR